MRLGSLLRAGIVCAVAAGVVPALAHEHFYDVALAGSAGSGSPGSGSALVTLDLDLITARVEGSFSGLVGNSAGIQLHCCTAVAGNGSAIAALAATGPAGFPAGAKAGSFDVTYDLTVASTYNPLFIAASGGMVVDGLNALIFGAEAGRIYLSIDTSALPAGEIRGFLVPVPEPGTCALMLVGAAVLGWTARRRQPA